MNIKPYRVIAQLGKVRRQEDLDYANKGIRIVDTLSVFITFFSALICYTENEEFREPIIGEKGAVVKDGFTS